MYDNYRTFVLYRERETMTMEDRTLRQDVQRLLDRLPDKYLSLVYFFLRGLPPT